MKLYILRHGNSPSVTEANVGSDAERPISELGRKSVRKMAAQIVKIGGRPAVILHSPLKRAVQTAQEAAKLLGLTGKTEVFPPLSNAMGGPELNDNLKRRLQGVEEVLIVGHQPQLGELAAHLSKNIFNISPAGLIALDVASADRAAVLWHGNPEDLPD